MSDRKRGLEDGGDVSASKKLKSVSTSSTTPSTGATDELIARKRAEIAAKVAKMAATAMQKNPASVVVPPKPSAPSSSISEEVQRKVLETQRRVAEAQRKLALKDNPYMSMPQNKKSKVPEPLQQGAGLKMAAHPLLLDQTPVAPQSKKDRYKPMQPKFASIKANLRNAPTPPPAPTPVPISIEAKVNPYASAAASTVKDTVFDGTPRERMGRNFRFNPKGKYVQLGNQMRQDIQLEQLKQRIAESAEKAGLDTVFEGLEKNIKRDPPPEAEWWDVALLPNKTYQDVDDLGLGRLNIRNDDSPITIYIQHPIPIPAPGDKNKVTLKPLKLTTKEQKKMRKQRRAAELQDKRDRIRMGLIPPDPPKVRLSNLMKVLTSDAVQDPTRVEARVRREVAMRKHNHDKMNTERKLTDDQRREKVENKKLEEEKKGLYGAVYKVKNLSDPAHRFKVRKNAEQNNLTGVCIFNPSFSVVYVEGAPKYMRAYRKLMLRRIAWTEPARPRGGGEVEIDRGEEEGEPSSSKAPAAQEEGGAGAGAGAGAASLEDNKCWLVWEGHIRDRTFNAFKPKSCPTDASAKEVLGQKLAGYWDMSKNWKPEEEEGLF